MSFVGSSAIMIKDLSGNIAQVTSGVGLQTASIGSNLKTGVFVIASSGSGGVALTTSGGVLAFGLTLKNIATTAAATTVSGVIHVGSSGNPPYISGGYVLGPGQEIKLNVNNPDCVRVYGGVSGVGVSWIGFY